MEETKQMIDARIAELKAESEKLNAGSEEYERIQKAIAELLKIRAQLDKTELVMDTKTREGWKDRIVSIATTAFSVAFPLWVYSHLWDKGLQFETDGYISSSSVKSIIPKFKFF